MNLKIPDTIFCSSPFSNIKKAYLQILKNLAQFFCSSPFQIFKKNILTNLKIPDTIFCSSPFSNIKKAYLQILAQFFAYSRFQILKSILINPGTIFCLFLFQILKKNTFKSLKTQRNAYSFFKY